MKLSAALKIGGIVLGAIAALTIVSKHPINILIIGVGAVVYFAGNYFARKGK
jgi:hypothetical protein